MKKFSYRVATISYCPDLTAPDAVSVPVAALLVSRSAEGKWTAFAMGLELATLGLDPLATALLGDLPALMRRNLDAAMKSIDDPAATPQSVLRVFHETLRTSVHVSHISAECELQVSDAMSVAHQLLDITTQTLITELEAVARSLPAPRVDPQTMLAVPPAHVLWNPAAPVGHKRNT